ncbi:hypothetical protein LTR86_009189 [Recurvomyces mirabilis]|nr:hypothetical protein LTR86_009189 [Recurvomyces mirabilis]
MTIWTFFKGGAGDTKHKKQVAEDAIAATAADPDLAEHTAGVKFNGGAYPDKQGQKVISAEWVDNKGKKITSGRIGADWVEFTKQKFKKYRRGAK